MLAHVSGDSWRLVHLAVSHGVICLWNLLWTAWTCARKMTFSWCDVHTQLFSLKIAGVEQILSMQQPLTVWAVSGADAKRLREERLARAGAAQAKALAIGLPFPKPAKGAGRPSARNHWHDVLYASIIAGDKLPDDVGLEPPAWWKRGNGFVAS